MTVGLYASAEWLIKWKIITDQQRALIPFNYYRRLRLLSLFWLFRGYFQGFQYMVPTGDV